MRLLVVGGDRRYALAAEMAAQAGYSVFAVGFEHLHTMEGVKRISVDELGMYNCVLLPIPWGDDAGMIPMPLGNTRLSLEGLSRHMQPGALILCGRANAMLHDAADQFQWKVCDLYKEEAFAVANAVPSAEGAIHAAMNALDVMLHGSHVLVIGYGRIGKVLASMLRGLGAHVTVAARRPESRAQAEADMHNTVSLASMGGILPAQQAVFSTPPQLVFGMAELSALPRDAVVLDLASAPYGVDLEAAAVLGIRAWREQGIPGRYSPRTAAKLLLDAVRRAIREHHGADETPRRLFTRDEAT